MDKYTLRQYVSLDREIKHLEAEKKILISSIGSPKPPDGMPHGSGTSDPTANIGGKWAELQMRIDAKLDELIPLRDEIEAAINNLNSADRTLMRLRYIDGRTWEEIAVELHYSYRWTTRLHGKILREIS